MFRSLSSLCNLPISNGNSIYLHFSNIKSTAERLTYIYLKDLIYDANTLGCEDWYTPSFYQETEYQLEKRSIGRYMPIKYSYLIEPSKNPLILIPLFEIYYPGREKELSDFFFWASLNEIQKMFDSSTGATVFSFVEKDEGCVVKSIELDKKEIFLNALDVRKDRSSYLIYENNKRSCHWLYVGAFIHNCYDEEGNHLYNFLDDNLLYITAEGITKKSSFEISLDVSGLINGFTVIGNDSEYTPAILKLEGVEAATENMKMVVKLISEVRNKEMGFRIEKYIGERLLNDERVLCDGVKRVEKCSVSSK
ncbi:hypothetical protein CDIK_2258 [Cucumispora dikerogammari]|nr:hypothetical protein CDIK_2258 [Cucumispora dikerogammari]